ncbi:MAG TPA: RagB/SusD family nutrient uptake outer membrane protein, partial [Cyclobacteriaceae bacterium]|nr:RagB/SusD family nutrient uptake outer membrane protein [Cyclobacteriaceae bacterium]
MKIRMKNKVTKAIALTLILSFAVMYSCDDSFLEVPVTGQLDQSVLSGRLGIESTLISAYAQVNGRANRMASPSNWVWGSIRGGDANKGTDPGDFSDINPIQRFEALPTTGVVNDRYVGSYEGVARCNAVMKLLAIAGPDVSDALKTSYAAQARFLRAHYYFELKRHFNNTPYVDETIDVGSGIEAVKNDVDLWPKIEADMEYAYQNLPATQGQVGRVNKWAAAAYLAKIYMYQDKFTEAKTLFDLMINPDGTGKVVTSNNKTWGLVPYYANIFKASNDNHEESIWAYQAAANTGSVNNANPEFDLNWPYNTGPDGPGNCCGFFQPSFELANSFRTGADGLPLLDGSYNTGANQMITDMGLESADAFTPDAGNLDPRIDHSIGRRGIRYLDWIIFPGKAWIRNQPNGGPYAPKKYVYYRSDQGSLQDNSSWTPGYTALNYTIIRYADVLLMAAEAEIEVGDPNRAKAYVNAVRTRAANSVLMEGATPAANYLINVYPPADVW